MDSEFIQIKLTIKNIMLTKKNYFSLLNTDNPVRLFTHENNSNTKPYFLEFHKKELIIMENKINKYIINLIENNDIVSTENLISYIDSLNLTISNFSNFIHEKENKTKLRLYRNNESFALIYKNIEFTGWCSINQPIKNFGLDYNDYEFYKHLAKMKDREFYYGIHKIPIYSELIFLIAFYHYATNEYNFYGNFDKKKFLDYFEEVCSRMDFSEEFLPAR